MTEKARRNRIEKLRYELTLTEKTIERLKFSLIQLPNMFSEENIGKKRTELNIKIDSYIDRAENLRAEIAGVEKGEFDLALAQEIKESTKEYVRKNTISKQRKKDILDEDIHNRELLTENYKKDKDNINYDNHYKKFVSVYNTLPEHLATKLADMPNNKGYIFRGINFFGNLPAERTHLITLFEKKDGNLRIHEWDEYETRIYEKKGKEKKVLIKRIPKKVRSVGRKVGKI